MDNNHFRKPLIQSALVIAAFLLFMLFIYGAQPTGFFATIGAVVTGIFKIILYIVGMIIGVLISITILIAIFLAAVAIFSRPQAKEFYEHLVKGVQKYYYEIKTFLTCKDCKCENEIDDKGNEELTKLSVALADNQTVCSDLQSKLSEANNEIANLQAQLISLKSENEQISSDKTNLTEQLEASSQQTTTLQQKERGSLEEVKKYQDEIASLLSSIEDLQKKSKGTKEKSDTVSTESGLFSYFETEAQSKAFIEKINEAVKQKLTYAQIDTFLTEKLDKKVDGIVKAHPTLSKKYIRSVKQ